MKMPKLKKASFKKPTPKKMRRIGNLLLLISVAASGYEVFYAHPFWGGAIAVFGLTGRVFVEFYTED